MYFILKSMAQKGMINPTNLYRVTSKFGNRNIGVGSASHNGIDIAAPHGTTVYAPYGGKVILANTTANGGKQLRVKHDNGITTGYAHLSEQLVKVGDIVKQGDAIAKTGNTGIGTGAHLHLTVELMGIKQDHKQCLCYV